MSQVFLRISRHVDTGREVAIRKIFGDDIRIVTNDLPYNGSPVTAINNFINGLANEVGDQPGDSIELVGIEPSGRAEDLVLITEHLGKSFAIVRPVFRRGPDGRVIVVGKDSADRDLFDVETYERLELEMRPTLVGRPLTSVPSQ